MFRLPMPALAVLLLTGFNPASAQETHRFLHNTNPGNPLFECGPKTIGQVGCQAGVRCKCQYDAFGSKMQGLPPGYRWDCGLNQGTCMSDVPATTSGAYGNAQPATPSPSIVVPYSGQGSGQGR